MSRTSVLAQLLKLGCPPGSLVGDPAPGSVDFYLRQPLEQAASSTRYVAPDIQGPAGETLWSWLRQFDERQGTDSAPARPDFGALTEPGGLPATAYQTACALEWLAASPQPGSLRRLQAVAADADPRTGLQRPSRAWVYAVWRGLFGIMIQCMDACGARPDDVRPECFPTLKRRRDDKVFSVLRSWPAGYVEDWLPFCDRLPNARGGATACDAMPGADPDLDSLWALAIPPQQDPIWGRMARLWLPIRVVSRRGEQWALRVYADEEAEVVFRADDSPWGRQRRSSSALITSGVLSPIALLMAAMAFDNHLSALPGAWNRLEQAMRQRRLLGVTHGQAGWGRDDVLGRVVQRIAEALARQSRATALGEAPQAPPKQRQTRFVPPAAAAAQPSLALAPLLDDQSQAVLLRRVQVSPQDPSAIWLYVPDAALGQARAGVHASWPMQEPTAYVRVIDTTGRDDAVGGDVVVFRADIEPLDGGPAQAWSYAIRPRPGHESVLLRWWSGQLPEPNVQLSAWLVNSAPDAAPWLPVLMLDITFR